MNQLMVKIRVKYSCKVKDFSRIASRVEQRILVTSRFGRLVNNSKLQVTSIFSIMFLHAVVMNDGNFHQSLV